MAAQGPHRSTVSRQRPLHESGHGAARGGPARAAVARELKKLFGLGKWAFDATDDSLESAPRDEALSKLESSSSTEGLDYEALLEAAGCAVSGRSEVNAYMENHEIYDYYTADYVDGHADHLVETKFEVGVEQLDVVEVGAGDGRLSQFLRRALEKRGSAIEVTATDDSSWRFAPAFPVENVDAERAAEGAHVAVAAWMPSGVDWTESFRRSTKLVEYILIGEAWDGCCGHNWRTHGNPAFSDEVSSPRPPYERDGFEKRELRHLSKLQLSRYDCKQFAGSSRTFSFRRRGMSTWTKRSVDLKVPSAPGFAVEYAVRGAGAPVVAVHCSGPSHKQWTPSDALGPNHRVVAPNLFGAGDDAVAAAWEASNPRRHGGAGRDCGQGRARRRRPTTDYRRSFAWRGRRFEVRGDARGGMLRPEKMPHNDNHIGRGRCCRGTKLYVSLGGRGAV